MANAGTDEKTRILLIDDEPNILRTFRFCLEDVGHRVTTASDGAQAEELVQSDVFDLCFLDLRLGEASGLDLLPKLRQYAPWMRVIIVTAHSSIDSALDAIRAGAADYLVKPCSPEQLRMTATKQIRARRLEQRLEALEKEDCASSTAELDSQSPAMKKVLETLRQVADTDATVLILGDSGSGKGVSAKTIHHCSPRAKDNFVTVNCPSLSAELLESELFGHKKGAFTGATENKLGRVDQAEGGTLFLDEVGDVPLSLQPKLLRFIQDREYERVGDPITRRANVRIIAATNRDLAEMVKQSTFREDLLYRLNVITIVMPPLRERPEDLAMLAERFLLRYAANYRRPARGFSKAALDAIQSYPWPGNIRELQNVIERAVILCSAEQIDTDLLSISESAERRSRPRIGDALSLEDLERSHIRGVMANASSLDHAAKTLGIDVSTLYRKRKQYGL
ncbi:MAG TPA: sigma-54 dependent transcriptional regulator [Rudaea sp.]|jgi:NtrC-family two-component system response regulator AlgB|nr:sigma-54 dependent transcriptional regulator [Rudaea sp.]